MYCNICVAHIVCCSRHYTFSTDTDIMKKIHRLLQTNDSMDVVITFIRIERVKPSHKISAFLKITLIICEELKKCLVVRIK